LIATDTASAPRKPVITRAAGPWHRIPIGRPRYRDDNRLTIDFRHPESAPMVAAWRKKALATPPQAIRQLHIIIKLIA
jgi:hypothetical protein